MLLSCCIAITSLAGVHAVAAGGVLNDEASMVELEVTTKYALTCCVGEPSEGITVTVPEYTPEARDTVLALIVSEPLGESDSEAGEALSQFPPVCVVTDTAAVTAAADPVARLTVCGAGDPPTGATKINP